MWAVRAILMLALILVVLFFGFNNFGQDQTVDVHLKPLFDDRADVSLVAVILWSLSAGAMLSLLMFITVYIKLSVQVHSARKKVRALEEEVSILRNRPIEESAELLRGVDSQSEKTESAFKDE